MLVPPSTSAKGIGHVRRSLSEPLIDDSKAHVRNHAEKPLLLSLDRHIAPHRHVFDRSACFESDIHSLCQGTRNDNSQALSADLAVFIHKS